MEAEEQKMSDINWNETAVYEFMRFEREPER